MQTKNDDYDKIEEQAIVRLKPQKPKMKISGKSSFLLAKLAGTKSKKR